MIVTRTSPQAVHAGVQETGHEDGTEGAHAKRPHSAVREQVPYASGAFSFCCQSIDQEDVLQLWCTSWPQLRALAAHSQGCTAGASQQKGIFKHDL